MFLQILSYFYLTFYNALIQTIPLFLITFTQWNTFISYFPISNRLLFVLITSLLHICIFTFENGFFHLCDTYSLFSSFKIPRKPFQIPSNSLIRQSIQNSLLDILIISPIGLYFLYPLFNYFGSSFDGLPSPKTHFFHILISIFFLDFSFYWLHRWFHTFPYLYQHYHKIHHEYKGISTFINFRFCWICCRTLTSD